MRRGLTVLALVSVVALVLAGCGKKGHDPGVATANRSGSAKPGPTVSVASDPQERRHQFVKCMQEHGVDMSESMQGPVGVQQSGPVDMRKTDAAREACKAYLPDGGDLKPPAGAIEDARKISKCMRENGVPKFPDPDGDGRIALDSESGIDPNDPTFKAAQEKCQKLFPPPTGQVHRNGG